jgi:ClpP class serine protease
MNYKLLKEIYGTPWFVDAETMQGLSAALNYAREGGVYDSEKHNQFGVYQVKSAVKITEKDWKLDSLSSDDQNISLIKLDGPITKNGGDSHYGTTELAQKLLNFDASEKIIGHIIQIESGGGSSNAVDEMKDAILQANKPVVIFCDGVMASAALYIGSFGDYIISHRDTDRIGSIGALIELQSFKKIDEDKTTGERYVRIYADQSTEKNSEFEAAINDLNFKPIIENILNPSAEKFINDMKVNRPNIKEEQLTGKLFKASEVVGTLIDQIGTFKDAVNKVIELSTFNLITNKTNNKMTKEELKQQHPDVYASIMNEGAIQEKDRVQAWLAFSEIDMNAVQEGIEKGENVTQKTMAEMGVKQTSKLNLKVIESENPVAVATPVVEKTAQEIELENFTKGVKQSAKLNQN